MIPPPRVVCVGEWVMSRFRGHSSLSLMDLFLNKLKKLIGRWTITYQMVWTRANAIDIMVLMGWGGSSSSLQKSVKFLGQFIYLAIDIYSMTYFIYSTSLGYIGRVSLGSGHVV